jgi:hypothetical protein
MSEDNVEIEDVEIFDDDNEPGSNTDQLKTPLKREVEGDASTKPVGIIKEEIIAVVKNPNLEAPLVEDDEEEADEEEALINNNSEEDDDNIYEQLKSHSIQLSKLSDTVESVQSQIKQLQETILGDSRKTVTSARRKKTIKTKKKTTGRKRTKRSAKK